MPPVLRSKGGASTKATDDGNASEPHPTYDEGYFAKDILLAYEAIVGKPGLVVFSNHPYITIRVGTNLAVFHINAEKWNNKSDYGKNLCSRMSAVGKFGCKNYRVDLPQEDESVFSYYIEYINTGSYRTNLGTFRATFCSQLKIYDVARRYGTADLAEMVLRIISDMLIESHPEQITRICFWSLVVSFVWDVTKAGDPLRDIISGFPTWYNKFGKGREYTIHSSTVQHALFKLKILPSANPFYQIAFTLFKDNPDYLNEKLDPYLGATRPLSLRLTQSWRDTIDDPTFEHWFNHWKGAVKSRFVQMEQDMEKHRNIFYDSPSSIEMVDDEDRVLFSTENKEKKVNQCHKKRKERNIKPRSSKKRSLGIFDQTESQEAYNAKKLLNPPKFLGEAIVNIKQDEFTGSERDTINDISSDLKGCRGEDTQVTGNNDTQARKDVICTLISLESIQNNAHVVKPRTNRSEIPVEFGFDGTSDMMTNRGQAFVQNMKYVDMSQYIPPVNDGREIRTNSYSQDNGVARIHPYLATPRSGPSPTRIGVTELSLVPPNIPWRQFDSRFSGDWSLSGNCQDPVYRCGMRTVPPEDNILEDNARYEGLDSEEWRNRNQPMCEGQYGTVWVDYLEQKAETSEKKIPDMSTVNDGFHGLPIFDKYGQVLIWNCEKGVYEKYVRNMPDNFQYDHGWYPQEDFYLPCNKSWPTSEEWAARLPDTPVSMALERTRPLALSSFPEYWEIKNDGCYHEVTRELGGNTHWAARKSWGPLNEPGSFANNGILPSYLRCNIALSDGIDYGYPSMWDTPPAPATKPSRTWNEGMRSIGL
ncbi:hypothetical protein DFP73DRAFT_621792 [Morchella snyderi]|nr:hypothetical protein DFP73DRAFT_621792 [Morchella snyderi]